MEIKFTYTKKEWLAARRKFLFLSQTITKKQLFFTALLAIMLTVLIANIGFDWLTITLLFIWFLSLIPLITVYFIQPNTIFNKTAKFHNEYHLQAFPEELIFETAGILSHVKWSTYNSYIETKQSFYLVQSKQVYALIPKRAFASAVDINLFRNLLKNCYNSFS